jgi:hypothetical protein
MVVFHNISVFCLVDSIRSSERSAVGRIRNAWPEIVPVLARATHGLPESPDVIALRILGSTSPSDRVKVFSRKE